MPGGLSPLWPPAGCHARRGLRVVSVRHSWSPGGAVSWPILCGGGVMATDLKHALEHAANWERHYVSRIPRPHLSRSLNARSAQDRAAGAITDFAGSMKFVYL